jgi:hypothetical protein
VLLVQPAEATAAAAVEAAGETAAAVEAVEVAEATEPAVAAVETVQTAGATEPVVAAVETVEAAELTRPVVRVVAVASGQRELLPQVVAPQVPVVVPQARQRVCRVWKFCQMMRCRQFFAISAYHTIHCTRMRI